MPANSNTTPKPSNSAPCQTSGARNISIAPSTIRIIALARRVRGFFIILLPPTTPKFKYRLDKDFCSAAQLRIIQDRDLTNEPIAMASPDVSNSDRTITSVGFGHGGLLSSGNSHLDIGEDPRPASQSRHSTYSEVSIIDLQYYCCIC